MKQLGNLAIVCAQRRSILFMVESGEVRVTIRKAPGSPSYYLLWMMIRKSRKLSTN